LYLKSSCTGDEDEVIGQYRNRSRTFPHETTADQFFNEGQFEAYRALGEHVGEGALSSLAPSRKTDEPFTYAQFLAGIEALWRRARQKPRPERELKPA
ncbi:MAG: hypothetical protein JOY81_05400, partial [Alphaproteobacteria bacterium]|nr:hypothetical protein [Alphaproteobacteria bacterium]